MFLLHLLQPGIPVPPVFSCLDQFLVLTTSEAYILAIHLASLVEMLVHCTSVRQSKRLFKNNTHRQGGAHILFMQSTASVHHTFHRTPVALARPLFPTRGVRPLLVSSVIRPLRPSSASSSTTWEVRPRTIQNEPLASR